MPWCPKCKIEYCEGVTVCSDCGCELVDELPKESEFIQVLIAKNKKITDKFSAYLDYSNIENIVTVIENDSVEQSSDNHSEDEQLYAVMVSPELLKKAKKAYAAFITVESENLAKEIEKVVNINEDEAQSSEEDSSSEYDDNIDPEGNEENEEDSDDVPSLFSESNVYIKKAEQGKELKSTAMTFYGFAIAVFIFFLLNLTEIITVFSGTISLICLALLSVVFLAVGINSYNRAKKAIEESFEEDELTEKLNEWMEDNITLAVLEGFDSNDATDEMNYLNRTEGIRKMLTDTFGSINNAYLDSVIEEFYNKKF